MSRTAAAYGKPRDDADAREEQKKTPSPDAGTNAAAQDAREPEDDGDEEEEKKRGRLPGGGLPAAKWIMILSGTASLIWFAAKVVTRHLVGESLTDSIDVAALSAALTSYAGAYTASALRKAIQMKSENGKEDR